MASAGQPNAATTEERYRLLVEAVTDYAIYMLDPTGLVTSWNNGAHRFKGYTADEIIGRPFSTFYTEEDRADGLPQRALATALAEGRFEAEGWRVRKDGRRFWAHVVIDPIRTPEGELIGFAKITRDLTERRQAEQALRHSQEQFRLLVQGVTDYAIYMVDPQGHIAAWNAGAERIKGYRPNEIIGQHFSRFYTEQDRAAGAPARSLETARREGRFEAEGWRVRKDGTLFRANVVIDPVRDDDGVIIGFAKVTRDITERVAAQRALDEAREALFQSQKMEALGQLTGGVAHDFNNLLAAVLGSLELVRKRMPENPRITPLIDNAIQGARRGATLTQRMLSFARKQELQPVALDVRRLVTDMSDLMARTLGSHVSLAHDFPEAIRLVQADSNYLEMALLNLCVNARDAMPDGGVITIAACEETVSVLNRQALSPGEYVCLSVTDTGIGMDEITLGRAIEPFFTTKGVGKGTGLGLSMVHGLAEQTGGRLLMRSEPGVGTTAELWLPGALDAANELVPETGCDDQQHRRSLVILAVDDDSLVLMNTVALLEDLGHQVLTATSGPEALELLSREPKVDMVVTDHAMPAITGAELIEKIGAQHPNLPVLLATGYAELPKGMKATPMLSKPFTQAELSQALASAIP